MPLRVRVVPDGTGMDPVVLEGTVTCEVDLVVVVVVVLVVVLVVVVVVVVVGGGGGGGGGGGSVGCACADPQAPNSG